jgi:hypothetical protein
MVAIKRAQDARAERVGIESGRVLAELQELAFSNIAHYVIDPGAGTVRVMATRYTCHDTLPGTLPK